MTKKSTAVLERIERNMKMKRAIPADLRREIDLEFQARRNGSVMLSETERIAQESEILEEALIRTLPRDELELGKIEDAERRAAIHDLERSGVLPWLDIDTGCGPGGWALMRDPPVPKAEWPTSKRDYHRLSVEERALLAKCHGFDPTILPSTPDGIPSRGEWSPPTPTPMSDERRLAMMREQDLRRLKAFKAQSSPPSPDDSPSNQ